MGHKWYLLSHLCSAALFEIRASQQKKKKKGESGTNSSGRRRQVSFSERAALRIGSWNQPHKRKLGKRKKSK